MNKFHSFKRPIMYVLLAALVVLLVYNWNNDFPPTQASSTTPAKVQQQTGDSDTAISTMRTIPDSKKDKSVQMGTESLCKLWIRWVKLTRMI